MHHKGFMYACHRTSLDHRTKCGMSNKLFVHKYVKRFVHVCVTGLHCIIGQNVVGVIRYLCINMSKGLLYMCVSQD